MRIDAWRPADQDRIAAVGRVLRAAGDCAYTTVMVPRAQGIQIVYS